MCYTVITVLLNSSCAKTVSKRHGYCLGNWCFYFLEERIPFTYPSGRCCPSDRVVSCHTSSCYVSESNSAWDLLLGLRQFLCGYVKQPKWHLLLEGKEICI